VKTVQERYTLPNSDWDSGAISYVERGRGDEPSMEVVGKIHPAAWNFLLSSRVRRRFHSASGQVLEIKLNCLRLNEYGDRKI
jgi:hypothetical protein